jgi:hypothetical protein
MRNTGGYSLVFVDCEILSAVALRLGKIVERHSQFKRATSCVILDMFS